MQETLEVRLKESTYQVVSDWPFNVKTENNTDDLSGDYHGGNSSGSMLAQNQQLLNEKLTHQPQQQPTYTTASQASQHSSLLLIYILSLLVEHIHLMIANWTNLFSICLWLDVCVCVCV